MTATPPEKQGRSLRQLATLALIMIASGALGFFGVSFALASGIELFVSDSILPLAIGFLPAFFFVILVHELGHVFGGRITGQRFHMLLIGPLKVIRTRERLSLQRNTSAALMGGLAVSLPVNMDNPIRSRLVVVAMGPLFSWLLSLLAWLAAAPLKTAAPGWADFLTLTALLSAVIALFTLIPSQSGGLRSDGAQLLLLLRRGAAAEELVNLIHLQQLSLGGIRPREFDRELLQRSLELPPTQPTMGAVTQLIAYYHYLDRGDLDQAGRHLEQALAHFPEIGSGVNQSFALEAAYFSAAVRGNLQTALAWLDQGKSGFAEGHILNRVQAAIAVQAGDFDVAREKIAQAREGFARSIDAGGAVLEEELLRRLEAQITQKDDSQASER